MFEGADDLLEWVAFEVGLSRIGNIRKSERRKYSEQKELEWLLATKALAMRDDEEVELKHSSKC